VMVHLKTWHVVSETKGQDQIRLIKNGSKKSLGANRGICVEETEFLLGFCFIRHAVFHFLWIHPLSKPAYPKIICCLSKRLKSWVFNPHPTKEDCSSYQKRPC
ncbi:hypothetical protein ACROAG_19015, partial [Shewanella oncorhynchi]|uniref:hypothetical protein n=1 Tax=Shewanella oncorhynchi TaxID=2726434 RepID=UPI003D7BA85B